MNVIPALCIAVLSNYAVSDELLNDRWICDQIVVMMVSHRMLALLKIMQRLLNQFRESGAM